MKALPTLKPAPGLFPAIDMPLGKAIVAVHQMQGLNQEITALKFGSQVIEEHGFLTTTALLNDIGNTLPFCFDRQKGATDVPFMVERQVSLAARYDVSSYIGSPLGAGSNSAEEAQGTLEAFVSSCSKFGVAPIVVLEMTQPGALAFSSPEQAEDLARRALALGVKYFVAPATKPDRIAAYRAILGKDGEIISPGAGAQKTGDPVQDAKNAIMAGADHIVVGRAIYNAPDPVAAAKEIYAAIAEAHLKREFVNFVVDNDVVGIKKEQFTLKSGRKSHWYANWRTVAADAFLADQLTDYVLKFLTLKGIEFDTLYGVPEGATKLAVLAQDKFAKQQESFGKGSHVLAMGRGGGDKKHGAAQDRKFLGEPRDRIVIIEDVTSTGGSLINEAIRLQEQGKKVVAAVGLTNRLQLREDGTSVQEAVEALGIPYFAKSTARDVLPSVVAKQQPSEEIVEAIRGEFKEFGAEQFDI